MLIESLSVDAKDDLLKFFMRTTEDAMIQVLGYGRERAREAVVRLADRFVDAPSGQREWLLHNDPVNLACELAGIRWEDVSKSKLESFNRTRKDLLAKPFVLDFK